MKDILIVVSPSKGQDQPVYIEIQKEIKEHGTDSRQILYTTYLLKGPKAFERAVSIERIARQYNFETAIFEIESVLKLP